MPQGFGARLLRVAPKIVQILLFLRRSQPAHRINGRANAIDGYPPLKPGNADRAVEDHHPFAAVHHKRGPARLHEMDPAFQPAGMAEPTDVPPVIDEPVIKGMVTDQQMHGFGRGVCKRSQYMRNGFLHPAERRITADLGIRIKLERKQEIGRTRPVDFPDALRRTPFPCAAGQDAEEPSPDFAHGALRAMRPETGEKRAQKNGPRIIGNSLPYACGKGIPYGNGCRRGRMGFGKFPQKGRRMGKHRVAVDPALFHRDIMGPQIPFLKCPHPDIPQFCHQNGFTVQRPPVPKGQQIRNALAPHEIADPAAPVRGPPLIPHGLSRVPIHHVTAADIDAQYTMPGPL